MISNSFCNAMLLLYYVPYIKPAFSCSMQHVSLSHTHTYIISTFIVNYSPTDTIPVDHSLLRILVYLWFPESLKGMGV